MVLAASTRTFFGSHPRSAHVPPKGNESIIATFHPTERHANAAVDAAVPVPITIKSNSPSIKVCKVSLVNNKDYSCMICWTLSTMSFVAFSLSLYSERALELGYLICVG